MEGLGQYVCIWVAWGLLLLAMYLRTASGEWVNSKDDEATNV